MVTRGLMALRKAQIGKEATRGTAVACDRLLLGRTTLQIEQERYAPEDEERANLALVHRQTPTSQGATIRHESSLSFEQIIHALLMGVKGGVAAATAQPTEAKYDDDGVFADMTNALDNNSGTEHNFAGFLAADDKVLVGYSAKFRAVKVEIGTTPNAAASTISTVEVSDGASGWVAATLVRDGTRVGGASLAQDGIIEFVPPDGWESDTIDSDDEFWVRFTWSGNWTADTDIAELDVIPLAAIWTFTPSLTARNAPDAYTFQSGDDVQAWQSAFCLARQLEWTIPMSGVGTQTAELFARFPTKVSFTSSPITPNVGGIPDIEDAAGHLATVYINDTWAELGDTQKSSLLVNAVIRLPTGNAPTRYAAGSLEFSDFSEGKRALEVELTFISQTAAITEYDAWAARTPRAVRLEIEGSDLDGVNNNLIRWDMMLQWTQAPQIFEGEQNNENTIRLVGRTFPDESNNWLSILVQNAMAGV